MAVLTMYTVNDHDLDTTSDTFDIWALPEPLPTFPLLDSDWIVPDRFSTMTYHYGGPAGPGTIPDNTIFQWEVPDDSYAYLLVTSKYVTETPPSGSGSTGEHYLQFDGAGATLERGGVTYGPVDVGSLRSGNTTLYSEACDPGFDIAYFANLVYAGQERSATLKYWLYQGFLVFPPPAGGPSAGWGVLAN